MCPLVVSDTLPRPFRLPEAPVRADLMAKYFRALGDPTRLRILELIADHEQSVGQLVDALGRPQPTVSNHLACLRWCGFVVTRREHRNVYYSIADQRVVELLRLAGGLLGDNAGHVACCRVIDGEAPRPM